MTSKPQHPFPILYYPLVKRGDRFAEVDADASLLQAGADIEPYLIRHHRQSRATVELRGRIAEATIWVPLESEESAYIAVDADRQPIEKRLCAGIRRTAELTGTLRNWVLR